MRKIGVGDWVRVNLPESLARLHGLETQILDVDRRVKPMQYWFKEQNGRAWWTERKNLELIENPTVANAKRIASEYTVVTNLPRPE